MRCTWHVHDMSMTCPRHVHDMYMTCTIMKTHTELLDNWFDKSFWLINLRRLKCMPSFPEAPQIISMMNIHFEVLSCGFFCRLRHKQRAASGPSGLVPLHAGTICFPLISHQAIPQPQKWWEGTDDQSNNAVSSNLAMQAWFAKGNQCLSLNVHPLTSLNPVSLVFFLWSDAAK